MWDPCHTRNLSYLLQRENLCNCGDKVAAGRPGIPVTKINPPEQWQGFPGGSVVKNLPANARDTGEVGSIPGLERSPGEGNGNPLQYSCLENSMDRGVWQATVHGVSELDRLSVCTHTHICTHTSSGKREWECNYRRRVFSIFLLEFCLVK